MSRSGAAAAATGESPPPRVVAEAPRSDIPHYTIDLDLPPAKRWADIIAAYRPYWADMAKQMWLEFEDLHGDHLDPQEEPPQEEEPAAAGKKKRKAKKPKQTAAQIAAAAAARHAEHVAFATKLASQLMAAFRSHGLGSYAEEMEAVSAGSGISLPELVLLNLSYEAHGGCTTILAPLADGSVMMGRTLDWQQPMLKCLTVELSFVRGGQLLYRATSFAGFLGVFTGHKPNAYSVAVNFRCADDDEGDDEAEDDEEGDADVSMREAPHAEEDGPEFSWPVGFLVRHTLESCSSYSEAIGRLHQCALMSQVYFIVCGTVAQQACIITRDPEGSVQPLHMLAADEPMSDADGAAAVSAASKKPKGVRSHAAAAASSFSASSSSAFNTAAVGAAPASSIPSSSAAAHPWLVQANMDHWLTSRRLDHQESLPRTRLVHTAMKQLVASGGQMTEAAMWQLMGRDPIWDGETIYATVSVPAQDRFVTLIENPCPPPRVKKAAKGGSSRARRR